MGLSEHDHQVIVVQWFHRQHRQYKDCIWSNINAQMLLGRLPKGQRFAVLNHLKSEGMKKGVSDLTIAVPKGDKHGLFIEMKKDSKGKLSLEQQEHIGLMLRMGYEALVCNGSDAAIGAIKDYMDQ